jgi:hypothetical protein
MATNSTFVCNRVFYHAWVGGLDAPRGDRIAIATARCNSGCSLEACPCQVAMRGKSAAVLGASDAKRIEDRGGHLVTKFRKGAYFFLCVPRPSSSAL